MVWRIDHDDVVFVLAVEWQSVWFGLGASAVAVGGWMLRHFFIEVQKRIVPQRLRLRREVLLRVASIVAVGGLLLGVSMIVLGLTRDGSDPADGPSFSLCGKDRQLTDRFQLEMSSSSQGVRVSVRPSEAAPLPPMSFDEYFVAGASASELVDAVDPAAYGSWVSSVSGTGGRRESATFVVPYAAENLCEITIELVWHESRDASEPAWSVDFRTRLIAAPSRSSVN